MAVTFPNFLHDSVIPLLKHLDLQDSVIHLLKHLDGKREYAMSKEAVFYIDMLMNSTHIKRAATMKTAKEMTREGAEATTSLEVREEQFRAKDME